MGAAAREQIVMVAGGGASGEQQLRHAGQRRYLGALFIQPCPNRVQGAQPVEELRVGRRSVGAGERLVQMVVRIDQARQGDEVTPVDYAVRFRQARRTASDAPDLAIFGVEVGAAQDLVLRVHQDQRVDIPN